MNSTIYKPATPPLSSHPSLLFPQIAACKTMRDLNQVHALFIKTGQIHDPLAAAEILKFCALSSRRDTEYARSVFLQMREPNCFSWNTIIRALAESDVDDDQPMEEALLLFCQMVSNGFVEPNRFTFPSVLKACAKIGNVEMGKQVHGMVLKFGLERDEFVVSNLVRMYVMCGVTKDAHFLFSRNVIDSGNMHKVIRDSRRQEDESHPRAKEIHLMLEEISNQLRTAGYKPDTTQVNCHASKGGRVHLYAISLANHKVIGAYGAKGRKHS
ncbi:hypothetical protein FEM48_Zijuj09G0071600 [Ziziphus jujuba var. spinosa]|uniref:Pentatricopeptide repeat-containing protein n=1 Tax=Ziziphus jujuba var. spinosa TaxID=714518 RepID=A0A978URK2_ZIZJJ|nr:hypothetical protein FEM48_Zijuj09G0071600 [Ziziphus jujuba var. spinosa]